MWLLLNLRGAEPVILTGAWLFLFAVVPVGCVLAAKVKAAR